MKDKNEDKALRELFRNKLENAEVIPSPSVGKFLMRKLTLKQFLRFNAARLNIWYAGGIAVAGALIAIVLTSDPGKKEQLKSSPLVTEQESKEVLRDTKNIDTTTGFEEPDTRNKIISEKQGNSESPQSTFTETGNTIHKDEKPDAVTSIQIPDISEEGLNTKSETERNNLKGKVYQYDNFIAASVTEGCAPLKVIFRSMIAPDDSCRWTFGDGGYSTERNTEWIFDIEGEYKVTLDISAADRKKLYSVINIVVHPRPVARFEITPEDAVIPEDEIVFMNYSSNAVRYKWNFGDGTTSNLFEPSHFYRKYGEYNVQLIAFSEQGCSDSLTIFDAYSGSSYFVTFPNAFIPNPNGPSGGYYTPRSDEAAHVFHPVYSGVAEYQLRIFSRLGILIFESNDINIGWDGYYKGGMTDPGVYIWKVRGKFINGEPFTKMGDVTLLRN